MAVMDSAFDSSSDSSMDDSDDDDFEAEIVACASFIAEDHPKQTGYLELVSQYSDCNFWRHFRVSRATFGYLIEFLNTADFRTNVVYHGGPEPLT